jgi:multiphosphoryl transfer protein
MTVALVIVSHSSQLAAGVAELASQMVQQKVPIVPAGGAGDEGEPILGTSADKILTAIQAVESPDGVLVLLDLGSAILSAEMALEMLDSPQQEHVLLSFAPLVEGTVAAAIEASLGHTLREVQQAAEKTADRQQLQLLKPIESSSLETEAATTVAPSPSQLSVTSPDILEAQLTITNPTGLHARPATLFVQTAGQFQATIEAMAHGRSTDATNIIGVLSLGIRQGDTLTLRATGPEAAAALKALSDLAEANFYEAPPAGATPIPSVPSTPSLSTPPAQVPPSQPSASQAAQGTWQGISTSRGVALGPALLYTSGQLTLTSIERHSITSEQVPSEQARLRQALDDTAQELRTLAENLQAQIGQTDAAIFIAQALMLQDHTLLEAALQQIAQQHSDAASALASVGEQQASALAALDNALLAARAVDVRDAVSRALRRLTGQSGTKQDLSNLPEPVILLAQDLTPSDTAILRPETVLGICTTAGGPTAHAAILARALGIPAIAGLPENALLKIHNGDELGLDADHGLLYHFPTIELRIQLQQRLATQQQQRTVQQATAQQTSTPVSIDGRHIALLANVGSEAEAEAARQWGAEGIGLLRTEFLFASASSFPSVDEQRHQYIRIFQAFNGGAAFSQKPIVVRTLDAGADKPLPALESILGATTEANPALGLRGIRISLAHPELLKQQITALLQAAAETAINLHIMFPMITTVEELRSARSIFEHVYTQIKQQHPSLPDVPVGIMVEVPSAALMAAELAQVADFFSIGANDLLQYTVACDRTNAAVAHLYHPMQPAVLRLIAHIAEAAHHASKPVAVCGEIASDPRLASILVGLGIDELSMTPTALPTIRTTLTSRSSFELTTLAQQVLTLQTVAEVEQVSEDSPG